MVSGRRVGARSGEHIRAALVEAMTMAATQLPADIVAALQSARARETSELATEQLDAILSNVNIARAGSIPMCQDTGIQTFFVSLGQDSPFLGHLQEWLAQAVREATDVIPLRPNTVHPFSGANPGDNTGCRMPLVNWEVAEGGDIEIVVLPKGGGGENMSALKMLPPGVGIKGIQRAIVEHVVSCGGKPCPPAVLGIGIGGGADTAMKLAKRAILRTVGLAHPEQTVATFERELLEMINMSGVGPMGLGGATTALAVHVEYAHRHPASLPLGIVVQCWAARQARVRIRPDGTTEVGQ